MNIRERGDSPLTLDSECAHRLTVISPRHRITTFLALAFALSMPGYWLGAHSGALPAQLAAATLMWAPGLSAFITLAITKGRLRSLGLDVAPWRYCLVALAIPVVIALPIYLATWLTGVGSFDPTRWAEALPYGLRASTPGQAALLLATAGLFDKLTRALGEEIGWRGLLVPELVRLTTPVRAALLSGIIWGLWHVPLIVFGTYHASVVPLPVQLALFMILTIGWSLVAAWVRLASGSVWVPALMHASWNLVVQSFLDQATIDTGRAAWWIGEFGLGAPIAKACLAMLVIPKLREAAAASQGL